MPRPPATPIRATVDAALARLLEEMYQSFRAGARVDLQRYVAAYPEYAEELRRLLPTLMELAQLPAEQTVKGIVQETGTGSEPNVGKPQE